MKELTMVDIWDSSPKIPDRCFYREPIGKVINHLLPKAPKDITLHFRVVSDSFMVTGNAAIFTINQQNYGTTNQD